MPRIQTFVSNKVLEDIDAIITERRQEGADGNEITMSSVTSMLVELGLRVYKLQREKGEQGFNQIEFNKQMYDSVLRTRAMCTEIMRMCVLSQEAVDSGDFEITEMKKAISEYSQRGVDAFFPAIEDETTI